MSDTNTNPLSGAALAVLTERQRQVSGEGWTEEHDDQHHAGELADAAACYAAGARVFRPDGERIRGLWPWSWSDWKPKDPRANLVRAAALLLAEIERLDRARADDGEGEG